MQEDIKNSYMAGMICFVGSTLFGIFAFNSGWNTVGQTLTIFTVMFGILGMGSFIKPKLFGPLAIQLLENMSKNTQEQTTTSFSQKGGKNSKNTQGKTINITEHYYHDKKTKSRQ